MSFLPEEFTCSKKGFYRIFPIRSSVDEYQAIIQKVSVTYEDF